MPFEYCGGFEAPEYSFSWELILVYPLEDYILYKKEACEELTHIVSISSS